jgi:transposase
MSYIKGEAPGQSSLFPPSLDELVPDDHPVRVIEAYVGSLDLVQLGFQRATPGVMGRPGYDPADLLKLYVYGYLNRVRSSRRLEQECKRNVEVMWLMGKLAPDHKTISDFRRDNGKGFVQVCRAFVRFCAKAKLLGGELVAIDGSKFQAVAARRRVVTQQGLQEQERKLEKRIQEYLKSLDEADRQEQPEPVDREAVRKALKELQTRQANCQTTQEILEELGEKQHVIGEADARLMSSGNAPKVGYNVQTAVDAKNGLIVHHEVTNEGTDSRQLEPVAQATKEVLGSEELSVVADTGYSNAAQFAACEEAGITPYVPPLRRHEGKSELYTLDQFHYDETTNSFTCPAGKKLIFLHEDTKKSRYLYGASAQDCSGCSHKARCTKAGQRMVSRHFHEDAFERMRRRLEARPDIMKKRKELAEHPFGQIKCDVMGNARFLLRGLSGARIEMALAVFVRNLKRVMNILGYKGLMTQMAPA